MNNKEQAKRAREEAKKARKVGDDVRADLLEIAADNLAPEFPEMNELLIDILADELLN